MKTSTEPSLHRLTDRAVSVFESQFNTRPEFGAAAPGRVNLIGEHTDYNDGLVMPFAIDRYTVVVAKPKKDGPDRFIAADLGTEIETFSHRQSLHPDNGYWTNYVKGVMQQYLNHGHCLPSIDAVVASDIPIGSGLSSSAALCVGTATLIETILGVPDHKVEKAQWCQQAEHEYARVPCGLMDHCISAVGREGHALLLDCEHVELQHVHLDESELSIVVVHTGVSHSLASGEYAKRRAQCETAVNVMNARDPKINSLRHATIELAESLNNSGELDELHFRRARHVISENLRVVDLEEALAKHDYNTVGQLMYQSHDSLRDDYQVSCDELDLLVEIAKEQEGVIGCRMTGGGFGGCVVLLTLPQFADQVLQRVTDEYLLKTNIKPLAFKVRPSRGAHGVKLSERGGWKVVGNHP